MRPKARVNRWRKRKLTSSNGYNQPVSKKGRKRVKEGKRERTMGGREFSLPQADLSPEIHINGIVRAAYAFLANVMVAFRHIGKEMFKNIYVTYVRPNLEYAAPFWNPHLKKHNGTDQETGRYELWALSRKHN
ncbi:hypothetical protein SK128_009585 [Halocaridina rubra]|uniref:Uncharacterized protein n=1 Tax=Halocaridina rubra TaxID=373956 RepID=A0AAN9A0W5_HALRR